MSITQSSLWRIVLAGRAGVRLIEFVRERVGTDAPKQFCAFVGTRTMLERTVRRAQLLIPSRQLVVSGTAHHRPYLFQSLGNRPPGTLLLQPMNRDTAPGILFPLIHILKAAPPGTRRDLPLGPLCPAGPTPHAHRQSGSGLSKTHSLRFPNRPGCRGHLSGNGIWMDRTRSFRHIRAGRIDLPCEGLHRKTFVPSGRTDAHREMALEYDGPCGSRGFTLRVLPTRSTRIGRLFRNTSTLCGEPSRTGNHGCGVSHHSVIEFFHGSPCASTRSIVGITDTTDTMERLGEQRAN